jgi:hypothetical protein
MRNKSEVFCTKIISGLSGLNIKLLETQIDPSSFKLSFSYARGQIIISGKDIHDEKNKKIWIDHVTKVSLGRRLSLQKRDCTLKNIIEILLFIFKDDKLPRCPNCGLRPEWYHGYEYGSLENETNAASLPTLNDFRLFNTVNDAKKSPKFVVPECSCGKQWRLKNYSSVMDIHLAYEGKSSRGKERLSEKEIDRLLGEIEI